MNERITLVSILDKENEAKITKYTSKISHKLCKVPYGKGVEDREKADTLPYHFTLYTFDIKKEKIITKIKNYKIEGKLAIIGTLAIIVLVKEKEVKEFLRTKEFKNVKVLIDKLEILGGKETSYVLVFSMKETKELRKMQKEIYDKYPSDYYHPNSFPFHITIHISKDKKMIEDMKKKIEDEFIPFELEVAKFGLFEIYPAKLVEYYE